MRHRATCARRQREANAGERAFDRIAERFRAERDDARRAIVGAHEDADATAVDRDGARDAVVRSGGKRCYGALDAARACGWGLAAFRCGGV